jgi:RHS repeat-associated protein
MWTWFSDPFGTTAANTNPAGARTFIYNLRFPGQIYDSQAGLQQNTFRDCYDPAIGRYCQPDPVGLKGGIDPYAYVGDNPLNYSDPSGLAPPGHTAPGISIPPLISPVVIPGSPENTAWSQLAWQQIVAGITNAANTVREACTTDEKGDCLKEIEQCMKYT